MKRDHNGEPSNEGAARARWVDEYRASGVGLKEFAKRHGLRVGQLHYWVYQLPKPRVTKGPAPVFQEVRLPAAVVTPGSWTAEFGLPNGTTVRLARQTDIDWTIALIECLRRPCLSH